VSSGGGGDGGDVDVARSRICSLLARLAGPGAGLDQPASLSDAVAQLEQLIGDRTTELEEKSSALAAANQELRSLTANLDQIVRQRTRALAESESQLRRKNAELDRLNRMKSEFISIAAHELRTPMTSVVGYLDLIAERNQADYPADLRRPLQSLRRNAHRLKRLIEDMLDVSRLETGRVILRRRPCSLGEIVQSVLDELRPFASQKQHRVAAVVQDVPPVDGDPDKIHQVVANLVQNSIKYTPPDGEIHLTVDTFTDDSGRRARLRVWDSGIGIPTGLRDRIFEPFSDMNAAKHHTSSGPDSAGLGLYIARGIVDLHGGAISVDSEEGKFTEFTVLFPLAEAKETASGAPV
jgi:signal transduction histidine kinase